jgi:transposase
VVTEVARRWQLSPQQVFGWRRQARVALAVATSPTALDFVPIVSEAPAAMPEPAPAIASAPSRPPPPIEVRLAGAVLRIPPGADGDLLTTVLRAIRASAT